MLSAIQADMSDEESFIVLGSTPTPSMEHYLADENRSLPSRAPKIMETSTQISSNNFSLIQADESLKSADSIPSAKLNSIKSISQNGSVGKENPLAASVIMGETNSSLFQTFPSLMQSVMPIAEVQMLQHLINEHGQMKDSLQKANVAMRKNFTNIQKWQDEVKAKYANQVCRIDEQRCMIDKLVAENDALKQELTMTYAYAKEHSQVALEEKLQLQNKLDEAHKQFQAERTAASVELDELKKAVSEKQSILQNMAREIERLELEKQEYVVVKSNKPDSSDSLDFITKEEHERQMKVLQREMSVSVAKALEFEDMKNVYVDEINCLKVNLTAAQELLAKNRTELNQQAKEIETKDVSLAENIRELKTLSEQVDVLTAQLDIYKNDFEAERTARADLASEKDRILSDLKLLQRRNQQLIEEVQNGRAAQETATRAANESLDRRSSPEAGPTGSRSSAEPATEEQQYDRPILHCPLCNERFRDLATLQNHVEDCVGIL